MAQRKIIKLNDKILKMKLFIMFTYMQDMLL